MPTLQQLTAKTSPTRREFIGIILSQDKDLNLLLTKLSSQVTILVRKHTVKGKINDIDSVVLGLTKPWREFWVDYKSLLIEKNTEVALAVALNEKEIVKLKYKKLIVKEQIDPEPLTIQRIIQALGKIDIVTEAFARTFARGMLTRVFPVGKPIRVGDRITSLSGQSLIVAKIIVEQGIRNGDSAEDITKNLNAYISPTVSGSRVEPFRIVRDRFNRDRVLAISEGKIPPGSVEFNARRLARTEISQTYRTATVEYHRDKPWVKGYKWNLSSSHPALDICDEYAAGGPYTADNVPTDHPQGLCFVTTILEDI